VPSREVKPEITLRSSDDAYHAAVSAGGARGEDGTSVPDALEVGGPGVVAWQGRTRPVCSTHIFTKMTIVLSLTASA
jgi:hypothetical protein